MHVRRSRKVHVLGHTKEVLLDPMTSPLAVLYFTWKIHGRFSRMDSYLISFIQQLQITAGWNLSTVLVMGKNRIWESFRRTVKSFTKCWKIYRQVPNYWYGMGIRMLNIWDFLWQSNRPTNIILFLEQIRNSFNVRTLSPMLMKQMSIGAWWQNQAFQVKEIMKEIRNYMIFILKAFDLVIYNTKHFSAVLIIAFFLHIVQNDKKITAQQSN